MNIFILDKDPKQAAIMQCDAHVVKMILESAQMLSTTVRELGYEEDNTAVVYKKAYKNHPCTIWARQSEENFKWLLSHAFELCREYHRRYGKRHKSYDVILACGLYGTFVVGKNEWPSQGLTEFAQAMPDEYRNEDAVVAYRDYYKQEKTKLSKFKYEKGRGKPEWLST